MENDLIRRSDVKESIQRIRSYVVADRQSAKWIDKLIDEFANIPAVDAVEVRHGQWLRTRTGWVYCSVCGEEPPQETNATTAFCPNCGAKMEV